MNGKYNHGFIAQEVKEVIDNYNLKEGFEMWQEDEADGRQRSCTSSFNVCHGQSSTRTVYASR